MARVFIKDGRQLVIGASRAASRMRGFPAGQNAAVTALTGAGTALGRQPTVTAVNQGAGQFAPLSQGQLAINLWFLHDYNPAQPFINVFKSARRQGGTRATIDADGYPQSLGPTEFTEWLLLWDLNAAATSINGRYRLWWDGQGTVSVFGRATNVDTSVPGRIEFNTTAGPSGVTVRISATTPGNHVRNFRCVKIDNIPAFESGQIFRQEWLRLVQGHHTIRFMDWQSTNSQATTDWASRARVSLDTYEHRYVYWGTEGNTYGVPLEVMIRLANDTGIRPWFCIPNRATEDWSRNAARLIRDTLNPDLEFWLEYSNETWNGQFQQAQWLLQEATRITGDSGKWMELSATLSARHMRWWAEELGPRASKMQRVLGCHIGYADLANHQLNAPWFVANWGEPPPRDYHDYLGVTGYYGNEWEDANFGELATRVANDGQTAAFDWATTQIIADINSRNRGFYTTYFGIAESYGKKICMYEGGTHVENGTSSDANRTAINTALNASAGSKLCLEEIMKLYESFRRPGDGPFMQFVECSPYTQYGSWGMVPYPEAYVDEANTTPRHQACLAYNAGTLGQPAANRTVNTQLGRATGLGRAPTVSGSVAPPPPPQGSYYPLTRTIIHSGHSLTDAALYQGPWPWHGALIFNAAGGDGQARVTNSKDTRAGSPMHWRRLNLPQFGGPASWHDIANYSILSITDRNDTKPESLYPSPGLITDLDERLGRREELRLWLDRAWSVGNGGAGANLIYYTCWPGHGAFAPASSWRNRLAADEVEWLARVDYAEANKTTAAPRIRVIPGNFLMMRLWDDAQAGLNPDVSSGAAFLANRSGWWLDDVHAGPYGNLALAYLTFAVIYGIDPRTLPHSGVGLSFTPNATLATYLKNVAREVATTYPRALP